MLDVLAVEEGGEGVGAHGHEVAEAVGVVDGQEAGGLGDVDGEDAAVAARPPPVAVDPHTLLVDAVGAQGHGVLTADEAEEVGAADQAGGAADVALRGRGGTDGEEDDGDDGEEDEDGDELML